MQINTIADIVGNNTKKQVITDVTLRARWVEFAALGGPARVGDTNVGAAQGANIAQNTALLLVPDGGDPTSLYQLSLLYAYVPTGTTLTITYGL